MCENNTNREFSYFMCKRILRTWTHTLEGKNAGIFRINIFFLCDIPLNFFHRCYTTDFSRPLVTAAIQPPWGFRSAPWNWLWGPKVSDFDYAYPMPPLICPFSHYKSLSFHYHLHYEHYGDRFSWFRCRWYKNHSILQTPLRGDEDYWYGTVGTVVDNSAVTPFSHPYNIFIFMVHFRDDIERFSSFLWFFKCLGLFTEWLHKSI